MRMTTARPPSVAVIECNGNSSWRATGSSLLDFLTQHSAIRITQGGHVRSRTTLVILALMTGASMAYYDPSAGKWLSRDPLGEKGGANLTAAFNGDPVNNIDPLGLVSLGDYYYNMRHRLPAGEVLNSLASISDGLSLSSSGLPTNPSEALAWAWRVFLVEGDVTKNPNLIKLTLVRNVVRIATKAPQAALFLSNSGQDILMSSSVKEAGETLLSNWAQTYLADTMINVAESNDLTRKEKTRRAKERIALYKEVRQALEVMQQEHEDLLNDVLAIRDAENGGKKLKGDLGEKQQTVADAGGTLVYSDVHKGERNKFTDYLHFLADPKRQAYWQNGVDQMSDFIRKEEAYIKSLR